MEVVVEVMVTPARDKVMTTVMVTEAADVMTAVVVMKVMVVW